MTTFTYEFRYNMNADPNNNIGKFNSAAFPELEQELAGIKARMSSTPPADKAAMITSFAKSHQIQASLVRLHPEVSKIISSRNACQRLETVYATNSGRADFILSLDQYLVTHFNE